MSGRIRTVLLAIVITVLVLLIGSCRFLGFINPGWALQGSWEITDKPGGAFFEAHTYLNFLPGAEVYQWQDADRVVMQSGPILNLTDVDFDYVIEENPRFPEFVGAENYAEYTLDRDDLTITFYTDREKSASIVSFIAVRE